MKKFLEALNEASRNYTGETGESTYAEATFAELRHKYAKLLGKRALYTCKSTKESRVVTIEQVTKRFIVLSYNCYGLDYRGSLRTTVGYSALISGEDEIGDVE